MSIPSLAIGAGNNDTANVFKIGFSQALSTAPKYEAWDNSLTYPAVDAAGAATTKEVFTGTAGNSNKPMLALVDTTGGTPGADWFPGAASAGSANPNLLKGQTNYVTSTATPGSGEEVKFNMCGEFPYDCTVPSTASMNYLLQIRYTYTGNVPSLTYSFNDDDAGGTEGSPVWSVWTPGTHGMKHCNTNTVEGTYKLTLPSSGVVKTGEIWITAS